MSRGPLAEKILLVKPEQKHDHVAGIALHERVARRLREEIIKGWRPPGSSLGEVDLAEEYGVSRNPVREALRQLEVEGFVVSRRSRGAVVAQLSEAEARGVLEVRAALETLVAGLAADRRTPADVARLRTILDEADDCMAADRFDRLTELNSDFHDVLARSSGNTVACGVITQLMLKVSWMYAHDVRNRGPHSWAEHRQVFLAIEAGDPDLARDRMAEHIDNATTDYRLRHARRPLDSPW